MASNYTKTNCLRVGARFDAKCTEIVSLSNHVLCRSSEIRYLGVNIVASRQFISRRCLSVPFIALLTRHLAK